MLDKTKRIYYSCGAKSSTKLIENSFRGGGGTPFFKMMKSSNLKNKKKYSYALLCVGGIFWNWGGKGRGI